MKQNLKLRAIAMRKKGLSIVSIEKKFKINKSTLSGWFKNITLNANQAERLRNNSIIALSRARKKAVIWHNTQKKIRLEFAKQNAMKVIDKIDFLSKEIFELALAMLYLGEGSKNNKTSLGNSNPLILKFYLIGLKELFGMNPEKMRYTLHLRADQNPSEMKKYWSTELNVPIARFTHTSIDQRTVGKSTYLHYKGVCVIDCGAVAIQRKLVYLSRIFCERILNRRAVSSVGRASP